MSQLLPVYTDVDLHVGRTYTTIVVDNSYFPVGEDFKLVNEHNQVRAVGKILQAKETSFDRLGYEDLKNSASPLLQGWANAAFYFSNRLGEAFSYSGPVQSITFEVISNIKFDTPLTDSVKDERELGLPTDEELGIEEPGEAATVAYTVED